MPFDSEPTGYEKGLLSDFQSAWTCLRESVVALSVAGVESAVSQRLLFHIDEAMSWECVRDLGRMRKEFLLINNIVTVHRFSLSEEVLHWLDEVRLDFDAVFVALRAGERI